MIDRGSLFLRWRKCGRLKRVPVPSITRRGEEWNHGPAVTNTERARCDVATRLLELDVTTGHRSGGGWWCRSGAARGLRQLGRPGGYRPPATAAAPTSVASAPPTVAAGEPRAIVDDVIDFALDSDEWEGNFGFVILRLRKGAVDGNDVLLHPHRRL